MENKKRDITRFYSSLLSISLSLFLCPLLTRPLPSLPVSLSLSHSLSPSLSPSNNLVTIAKQSVSASQLCAGVCAWRKMIGRTFSSSPMKRQWSVNQSCMRESLSLPVKYIPLSQMNGLIYMQYAEWAARPYIQPARIWLLLNRSDLKPASSGQLEARGWDK